MLTKQSALVECRRLWTWLAKHPDKTKLNWPGWKRLGRVHAWACPPCEYADQQRKYYRDWSKCKYCPLIGYAWDSCTFANSNFSKWCNAPHTERGLALRTKCALEIAAACTEALKDDRLKHGDKEE